MTKRNKAAIPASILVGVLLSTTYHFVANPTDKIDENASVQVQNKFTVDVLKIKNEGIQIKTNLEGRVSAYEDAEIRPQIGGIIKDKMFEDGQFVKAGDILYKIDDSEYKAELNIAKAALNYAETDLKLAKQKRDRYKNLIKNKAVSQQDFDDAQAHFEKLNAIKDQRLADYNLAAIKLGYTDVRSPIDGYTDISKITKGELVTANQQSTLTIVTNIKSVYIDMTQNYDEYLKDSKQNIVSTRQAHKFVDVIVNENKITDNAMLISTGKIIDKNTGSIKLRAVMDNEDGTLIDGQYVKAEILHGYDINGIIVPQSNVQKPPTGSDKSLGKVKVVSNGIVKTQDIKIDREVSLNGKNYYLVASGLEDGDLVIVSGGFKVRDGDSVNFEILNGEKDG